MKISELPRLSTVRLDAEIPVAVENENYNVTLGQITKSLSNIVRFGGVAAGGGSIQYVNAAPPDSTGTIVFDSSRNSFFLEKTMTNTVEEETVTTVFRYNQFTEYSRFYDSEGYIRTDCLFIADDGRAYVSDGENIQSAGITEEQVRQIRHATPIEVASEEEMRQRIESGAYEEGQL